MKRVGLCGLVAAFAWTAPTHAQVYPAKAVRIVAAYPAGTGVDITARILAQKLTETLGQQFVVDNRAGAGGNIAAEIVAKAPPDGYTLLYTNNALTINPNLYRNLAWNALRDFEPLSLGGTSAQILVAHPSLPANTVKELVALARSRPGQVNVASAGNGSPSHLAGALFKHVARIDVVHVPYKGAPAALTDLISGQVDVYMSGLPPALAMMKARRVKGIAVTTAARSPAAPEVPTIAEAGYADYDVPLWYGLLAPAGVAPAITSRLSAEVVKALAAPDVRERYAGQGVEPTSSTQPQFAALLKSELDRWGKLIKAAGIRVE